MQESRTPHKKFVGDTLVKLERQVHEKYPEVNIDREILSLVGKLPSIPARRDNEITRRIIAEKYG